MKKQQLILTLGLIASPLFSIAQNNNNDQNKFFEISKGLEIYSNVFKELNTLYVDPIEPGKMNKDAIDAMLEQLDPYTVLFTEADSEDYEFQTTGKYGGIGVSFSAFKRGKHPVVSYIQDNSPADKAGIKIGDILLSIDNNKIDTTVSPETVSKFIKGTPGTELKIVVANPITKQEKTYSVKRDEIQVASVPYAALLDKEQKIAYVSLNQFTRNCSKEIRANLEQLKNDAGGKLNGIILDLRNNPGGLLDEAVNICNLFIDKNALVVSTKSKNKATDQQFKTQSQAWDKEVPVAVLINSGSASASEVVAGTLQDLDRGVVIGGRSYGKGLVQNVKPVGYNYNLKITIAKYYTPSGRCIQAIDYSHKNDDGSVSSVPDSLKKPFKTATGRTVYDGGGIEPDEKITTEYYSRVASALSNQGLIFDYATKYYYETPKEKVNVKTFNFTDADYTKFKTWLKTQSFEYKTEAERALDYFKTSTEESKVFKEYQQEFNVLKNKIIASKEKDLDKYSTEIKDLIATDIISRYYSQKGRIEYSLTHEDRSINKALEILKDNTQYKKILNR